MGIDGSPRRRGEDAKKAQRKDGNEQERILMFCGLAIFLIGAEASPTAYTNDFEKAEVGKVPDELMVLDGTFAVREVDGNKCLELAPDPVGSYGAACSDRTD